MRFRTNKLPLALVMIFGLAASICSAAVQPRKFKHVVIILQENRTVDNVFGSNPNFEPGVDIQNFGYLSNGQRVSLASVPWDTCFDPEHSLAAFQNQWDKGKMDGADKNQSLAYLGRPGCGASALA